MAIVRKASLRPVTEAETATLVRISKASSERMDRVRRAVAVLSVAEGQSFAQAAHRAGLGSGAAVSKLVVRFNQRGVAALRIATGRGRKPTYDAAARAQIIACAQQPPSRRADGTATWSLNTLQRALRKGELPQIGATTIRRVLEDAGASYQRTRTWCPTGTAVRVRKTGAVRVADPKTEEKRG